VTVLSFAQANRKQLIQIKGYFSLIELG
jgi:hypothetical protein